MRIPFSLNLRHGTDIVVSKRILDYAAPDSKRLVQLTRRFLHHSEIIHLNKRFPWWQQLEARGQTEIQNLAHFLAGRWAAKEAAKKAWGAQLVTWKNLRVEYDHETKQPRIICNPWHVQTSSSIEQEALLSISHDGDYAVASVIATPLEPVIQAELQRIRDSATFRRYQPANHDQKPS